jgi:hypothetical protein
MFPNELVVGNRFSIPCNTIHRFMGKENSYVVSIQVIPMSANLSQNNELLLTVLSRCIIIITTTTAPTIT